MKDDAPERIGLIRGPFGGWRLWDNTSSHEEADARYIRADAPPTLAEAMTVPEVRALAEALQKIKAIRPRVIDETGFQTGPASMLNEAQAIARAALASLKGDTP
jgi:hypothetical protein